MAESELPVEEQPKTWESKANKLTHREELDHTVDSYIVSIYLFIF